MSRRRSLVPSSRARPSLVRRGAALLAFGAAALLGGAAAACTDVPSDPNTPISIEFDTTMLPSLAIVDGDTLRDAQGNVAPLRAVVRNVNGAVIENASVTFVIPDSAAASQTLNVHLVNGDTVVSNGASDPKIFSSSRVVRLVAAIGNLQAASLELAVVLRPSALQRTSAASIPPIVYGTNGDTADLYSDSLGVRVVRGANGDTGVRRIRVQYRILDSAHATVDSVRITRDTTGRDSSSIATANESGFASRRLRIRGKPAGAGVPEVDTVVVEARVILGPRPADVLGPVQFLIPVRSTAPPATP